MPPKKARISTSDVPAWQRSIAGFQTVCTVASTSTSTCSSSHAVVANEETHDSPKRFVSIISVTNGRRTGLGLSSE